MRKLTMKFGNYKLAKFEKQTGKGVMDLLDIGNLEINKIAQIIKLGNTFEPGADEDEEAYKRLDNYLSADEEHSIISAFFDLIDELDKDLKIMKACGLKVSDIKEQFKAQIERNIDKTGLTNPESLADKVENNVVDMPIK